MIISDMIAPDLALIDAIEMWGVMETIADRVNEVLRRYGKSKREKPYEQWELVAMLNGDMVAPNGKIYHIANANKSTISKMMNDKQRWQVDMLAAICEMFEQDANWLINGMFMFSAI